MAMARARNAELRGLYVVAGESVAMKTMRI